MANDPCGSVEPAEQEAERVRVRGRELARERRVERVCVVCARSASGRELREGASHVRSRREDRGGAHVQTRPGEILAAESGRAHLAALWTDQLPHTSSSRSPGARRRVPARITRQRHRRRDHDVAGAHLARGRVHRVRRLVRARGLAQWNPASSRAHR